MNPRDVMQMEAGRELDALACQRFGIPGRVQYFAQAPGSEGSGWTFSARREEVIARIREMNELHPDGWAAGSTVEEVTHYPEVSRDMGAAWQVFILAMETVGTASIHADMEDYGRGTFTRGDAEGVVTVFVGDVAATAPAPLAVCRASLLACAAAPAEEGRGR